MIEKIDGIISGIYCIENSINGKMYIGSSKNIKRRWHEHLSELRLGHHDNDYLQKSYNKYGKDIFFFYVMDEIPEDELSDAEDIYIRYYDTRESGYNLVNGGNRNRRLKFTKESRKRLSKAQMGKVHTQDHKNRTSRSVSISKIGTKPKFGSNNHVGVYLNKNKRVISWLVRITFKKVSYELGTYLNEQDAIDVYESALYFIKNSLIKDLESEG
jgi:group I intron endonuclease